MSTSDFCQIKNIVIRKSHVSSYEVVQVQHGGFVIRIVLMGDGDNPIVFYRRKKEIIINYAKRIDVNFEYIEPDFDDSDSETG